MKKFRVLLQMSVLLGVAASLVVSSPAHATAWLTYWGDYNTSPLVGKVVTPDGIDSYTFSQTTQNYIGTLSMSAPASNTGGNLRQLIWPQNVADSLDQQSCATWVNVSDESNQEGLALRIVDTPQSTRAITVTKNVIYGVHWVFNVHVWDTTNPSQPFTQVAQFDMLSAMYQNGALRAKPWRACARVVGDTVDFKIWFPFQGQTEPAWGDPTYSRSATISQLTGWNQPGKPGWYIGHLRPGDSASYNGMITHVLLP